MRKGVAERRGYRGLGSTKKPCGEEDPPAPTERWGRIGGMVWKGAWVLEKGRGRRCFLVRNTTAVLNTIGAEKNRRAVVKYTQRRLAEGYAGSPESVNSLGSAPSEPLQPPLKLTKPPLCIRSVEGYKTCPYAPHMRVCACIMRLCAFHVRGNACGTSATVYCVRCRACTHTHVRVTLCVGWIFSKILSS